jgi:AraC-like DNA-binding protein
MHTKKSYFTAFQSVISVVILFFSLSLNAQTDSLQGKSYDELIKLFESALFKNANDAKTYAIAANRIAKKENNKEKIGSSIYYIAYADSYIPSYQEALQGIDISIAIANELKDNLLLFKNHNLKGNILSETKKELEALDEYKIAKQYADLTDDPLNEIVVSINIAFIKKNHKNHKEAITLFKENLELLKNIQTHSTKKDTYEKQVLFNLADTYLRIKNPKEAAKYNTVALEKCNEQESPMFYHILLMNDAIINYQTKNYDKTIEISKKAENYFLSINNEDQLVTPYFYIGKSYFQQKKYRDAIHYLEKTNDIINRKNIAYSDHKDGYEILYKSYNQLGDINNATKSLNTYLALDKKNDSIDISVNNKIHNEHGIVPLQDEIALLDNTNQKQQKRATYLYLISALLLVSLIGFFIWFKRKQHQNKTRFQQLLLRIEKLEQPKEKVVPETLIKETSNPVTDENALQILKALAIFEEKELYLRQDCTLGYVAKKAKTNTTYLSNVINTYKEKPFKSYLSELRINAALIKLKNDEKLRSYTIKAIAEEFGFKRSETFSRAFKAQTDVYPSYYIKSLQNQKNI